MRIVFTADIHWDISQHAAECWAPIIDEISELNPDVLVLGGDIAAVDYAFRDALKAFSVIDCQRCYVLGNHDIWILNEGDFENSSFKKYDYLCEIGKDFGFHCLEKSPLIINRIGFVGNCGWYDYSFRDKNVDIFFPLALKSYKEKRLPNGRSIWRDGQYAKWGISDEEVTQFFVDKTKQHIKEIDKNVEQIAFFSHHIPIERMIRKGDMNWNMGNAFAGSVLFENLILSHQKIKYIFCGHSHTTFEDKIKSRFCCNVGSDYLKPRYKAIDV